jgi:hypothetical protein
MTRDMDKHRKAKHDWYKKNKELTRERGTQTRHKRRKVVNDLKEASPCVDCNVNYPYYVMHYDHLDSDLKVSNVSHLLGSSSMEAVLNEIEKCELVCANCHAFRTWRRRAGEL